MSNRLINVLTDEGSYLTLNAQQKCGVETGMMTVLSRPVSVLAVDENVLQCAEAEMLQLFEKTLQTGTPLILLFSKKETVQPSVNLTTVVKALVRLSGVCPVLALVAGEEGDLAAAFLPFADFTFYAEGSHERTSTVYQARDLLSAIENLRTLLSYLPLNCAERAPVFRLNGDSKHRVKGTEGIICCLADPGAAFELYPDPHTQISFVRINGRSAGVIWAQDKSLPAHAARFMQFCDCFSLPIVIVAEELTLNDQQVFIVAQSTVPMIAIGSAGEYNALFDAVISNDADARENTIKALEYLSVKRDILPPHKHGNMPI